MPTIEPPARDVDPAEWLCGARAAEAAIEAARRSGDWEPLDALAMALGIGLGAADRGAWDAICEALCGTPR